jgi:hypothetical protein
MDRRKDDRYTRTYVEMLGLIVGSSLVLMMIFTTVAPFFVSVPQASIRLIDQQQTILQSVFLVLVGYLWRDAEGSRVKNETINTLAKTAAAVAPPTPSADVTLKPGDTATVAAEEK